MSSINTNSLNRSLLCPYDTPDSSKSTSAHSSTFNSHVPTPENSTFTSPRSSTTSIGVLDEGYEQHGEALRDHLLRDAVRGMGLSEGMHHGQHSSSDLGDGEAEEGIRAPPVSRDEVNR